MKDTAFIGIGSNLGDPVKNCEKAIGLLQAWPKIEIVKRSSLYESEPVGEIEQDWFINAVIAVTTSLIPEALLKVVLEIENDLGRTRREKWGPRIIDLDILTYENQIYHSTSLTLPHPSMAKRKFVLLPLSEFAGDYIHPVEKKSISDLLKELPESPQVKKISSQL
jgi:2-amino-4-hydroxy-6-hydroxymethyldihydropteridine diphosphokinase